jgi:hypothetical protein
LLLPTDAYLGEGFDHPVLDTLSGLPDFRSQSRRSVHRPRDQHIPGETSVEVHNYHDTRQPLLRRMHQRHRRSVLAGGARVAVDWSTPLMLAVVEPRRLSSGGLSSKESDGLGDLAGGAWSAPTP